MIGENKIVNYACHQKVKTLLLGDRSFTNTTKKTNREGNLTLYKIVYDNN